MRDRFRGALVGTFLGDALGAPVEGMRLPEGQRLLVRAIADLHAQGQGADPWGVLLRWGDLLLDQGGGRYTDDTQLTLALAEALLDAPGRLDLDRVAARFGQRFEADRGYGANARAILGSIRAGAPWRLVVEDADCPEGSFANGAAMRVAPVALAFYPDASAIARAAEEQGRVTGHHHPEARFGARLQALAVHRALEDGVAGRPFDLGRLLAEAGEPPDAFLAPLSWIRNNPKAEPEVGACALGTGVLCAESVPTALWCFLSCMDDPDRAVIRAVSLGGDADTIAAMAGAIAGAYHGASAFPSRWLSKLHHGPQGIDFTIDLADRLLSLSGVPLSGVPGDSGGDSGECR